jgi:hypothetical protein
MHWPHASQHPANGRPGPQPQRICSNCAPPRASSTTHKTEGILHASTPAKKEYDDAQAPAVMRAAVGWTLMKTPDEDAAIEEDRR